MTEDPSNVDTAQLERWAYGRAATPADQERAALAAGELQRRAALEREREERAAADRAAAETHARAVASDEGGDAEREHPAPLTDTERRHRRRMRATGISGLVAAALALSAEVVVLSQPNPDPLAIFDRPESALDREWAQQLADNGITPQFVAGPRAVDLGSGVVAVAARVSTLPDGRSTTWDLYCLYVGGEIVDEGESLISANCTYPEQFERVGMTVLVRPSASGIGLDTVSWGPTGEARLDTDVSIEEAMILPDPSVLFWMTYPGPVDLAFDPASVVSDTSQLLMGPALVPLLSNDGDLGLFLDSQPTVSVYLTRDELTARGAQLCIHVSTAKGPDALGCDLIGAVRRNGIDVPVTADGRSWLVRIGADGPDRTDTVELRE